MAGTPVEFHRDIVHDAQFDYYGRLLATASSDRSVRVYSVTSSSSNPVSPPQQDLVADLKGHEAAVWSVSWAHPKFGNLLASCSYDRSVIVWQERRPGEWVNIYRHTAHSLSVNSVSWAPHELGICFAAASSDGTISIAELKTDENRWLHTQIPDGSSSSGTSPAEAHKVGVNAVSWGPAIPVKSGPSVELVRQLASAGCDHLVRIWTSKPSKGDGAWECVTLAGHTDWVRDVAWAPNIGVPRETIASCSEDGTVIIWTNTGEPGSSWVKTVLPRAQSNQPVWSVSWSTTANLLAVASGEEDVSIWKENTDGEWRQIGNVPGEQQ
ncbi:MAG: hypothetical protein Q8P67_28680 [archaeon]|nr:hypothetical protein [archaeon]